MIDILTAIWGWVYPSPGIACPSPRSTNIFQLGRNLTLRSIGRGSGTSSPANRSESSLLSVPVLPMAAPSPVQKPAVPLD